MCLILTKRNFLKYVIEETHWTLDQILLKKVRENICRKRLVTIGKLLIVSLAFSNLTEDYF